jgi:hypothetical protein
MSHHLPCGPFIQTKLTEPANEIYEVAKWKTRAHRWTTGRSQTAHFDDHLKTFNDKACFRPNPNLHRCLPPNPKFSVKPDAKFRERQRLLIVISKAPRETVDAIEEINIVDVTQMVELMKMQRVGVFFIGCSC